MKKISKSVLCILLAIIMAIPAGCGKNNGKEAVTINKDTIYKEERLKISIPTGFSVYSMQTDGEIAVFTGYEYNEQTQMGRNAWIVGNLDGSSLKTNYLDGDGWIEKILLLDGKKIGVMFSSYFEDYSDPENPIYENTYEFIVYDETGKELNRVDISETLGDNYVQDIVPLSEGKLLLYAGNTLMHVDENFKILKKNELPNEIYYYGFNKLKDGRILTNYWNQDKDVMGVIDPETLTVTELTDVKISTTSYGVVGTSKDYDILLSNSSGIFGYNFGDEEPKELMNFVNSDLDTSYFDTIVSLDDGSFIGTYNIYEEMSTEYIVAKYTKVDPSTIPDKKIITLGCLWLNDEIRKNVIDFNKKNDNYRITVTDYSKFNTDEDWEAGTKKLNAEIAAGQCPDIIIAEDASTINNYMKKGLFEDLTKYIEQDPDIDIDDIFPNLVEATSYKDKIYEIIPSFYVMTVAGKKSKVGDRTSWTFEEFMDVNKNLPEGTAMFNDMFRDTFLYYLLSINSEEYIDFANAKCYFNSPEFISALEYMKTLPESSENYYGEDYDWEAAQTAIRDDRALLDVEYLAGAEDIAYLKQGTFGEDISLIGLPCKEGTGAVLSFNSAFAISSKCKNPDAAWEFVRIYLTKDYQSSITYGIPALMSAYDKLGETAMEGRFWIDENGEKNYFYDSFYLGGEYIDIMPPTKEEVEELKEYTKTVNKVSGNYDEITKMIEEETEPFFAGQKTAEEVVAIIQSRVTIYLNEKQ